LLVATTGDTSHRTRFAAFADGFVSLLLPIYLVELGFSALAI
jgi:hypothetical protein